MLARLAQAADRILLGYGNPKPYREALAKAIEREGAGGRAMPVLVSRLLPPTEVGRWDDPTYREGYLRKALAEAKEGYARDVIAAEMVRENLEAQWPVLERVFYAEKRERGRGSDARIGILKALGEAPHTAEKTQRLVELIDDPRNETLLTQVNQFMGMDMYRHYAAQSLNAIAGGNWVSHEVLQDLGRPERSVKALAELRRLAHELSKRQVE
jgi:hypothetical protein